MNCPDCTAALALADNFCPRCGASRPGSRLPVKRQPSPAPTVWRQAAPVLARSAALVAAGVIGEWLLSVAARRVLALPARRRKHPERGLAPRKAGTQPQGAVAVSETLVVRRVILRR